MIEGRNVYYLKKDKDKKEVASIINKMKNIFKEFDNWFPDHLDDWAKSINYWIESDEELLRAANLYVAAGFYNASESWSVESRWIKEKVKGVSINAYIEMTSIRTTFILHETVHAFHDQKIKDGFKNQVIIDAYESAKSKNIYHENEYAMTNALEFFADASTWYLEQSYKGEDSFKKKDPKSYEIIKKILGSIKN